MMESLPYDFWDTILLKKGFCYGCFQRNMVKFSRTAILLNIYEQFALSNK